MITKHGPAVQITQPRRAVTGADERGELAVDLQLLRNKMTPAHSQSAKPLASE